MTYALEVRRRPHIPTALQPWKEPPMAPIASLDHGKVKTLHLPGLEVRPFGQSASSQLLNQLRCHGLPVFSKTLCYLKR
jgi:hypothetical protein